MFWSEWPWFVWMIIGAVLMGVAITVVIVLVVGVRDEGMLPDLPRWRTGAKPFALVLDEALLIGRVQAAVCSAVAFWEAALPGVILPLGEMGDGDNEVVPIMPMLKLEDERVLAGRPFGYTRLTIRERELWSAAIYLDTARIADLTDLQLWRAIAHELGHVLGLAHDYARESVMWPKTLDEPPVVTLNDRALLAAAFTA